MSTAIAAVMGESSDDALIAAALGDREQFALIYLRYRLPVYRYLRARGADDDEALDLAASTFERALRALPTYHPRGGGLGAWLFRIARNARIDEHRRQARLVTLDDGFASTGEQSGSADEATELRLLVAQLAPTAREAIALRYGAGLTSAEIGHVLGKRPEAAQKLIERALADLREALDDRH